MLFGVANVIFDNRPERMKPQMKQNILVRMLKGAIISIGALLPGISGGALCVILGIYKPMMELLNDLPSIVVNTVKGVLAKLFPKMKIPDDPFAGFKKYFSFFWPIAVGLVVGALGISKILGAFMEKNETAALFLFIGLILGTLPSLLKEARQEGVSGKSWLALVISVCVMLAWMIPMSLAGQAQVTPSFLWWCVCGVLWGLGIIVPGMSPSNIFFFLGIATPMYAAIGALDMGVLVPMMLCLLLTIVLLSRFVGVCLKKWYSVFMHAVVGIVIASTIVILPPVKLLIEPGYSFATGAMDFVIYAVCFLLGLLSAWGLGKIDK